MFEPKVNSNNSASSRQQKAKCLEGNFKDLMSLPGVTGADAVEYANSVEELLSVNDDAPQKHKINFSLTGKLTKALNELEPEL